MNIPLAFTCNVAGAGQPMHTDSTLSGVACLFAFRGAEMTAYAVTLVGRDNDFVRIESGNDTQADVQQIGQMLMDLHDAEADTEFDWTFANGRGQWRAGDIVRIDVTVGC
ncbi:hypothetical protein [Actinoplanes sp. NPDC051494]|uniref:hypothetical protein n=1 Tax=Actinoplanes sp. NPDC051494 TaxID=3363907 RepID=UPI003792E021